MAQITEKNIHENTNSSAIVKHLFLAELKRLDNTLADLVRDNENLQHVFDTVGFQYQGEFYKLSNADRIPPHGERLALHGSLVERMQRYLDRSGRLLWECTQVNQMVFRLVQGCTTRQDVRDALPECLVAQDKEMGLLEFERTRPAAYTLDNDKRAMKQYEKILPIIEYYSGTHLLF